MHQEATFRRKPVRPAPKYIIRLTLQASLVLLLAACVGDGDGDLSAVNTRIALVNGGREVPAAAPFAGNTGAGSNAVAVGGYRALGATGSVTIVGVPEAPPPAPELAFANPSGRTFHVDSVSGNDRNDGRAATAGAAGKGPWRSLARVMQSDLGPGDTLLLACGSEWHETLRLPASGTAARPVAVAAPPGGCTTRPAIDGSVLIPPNAWSLHRGSIYKAALDVVPLQLFSGADVWTEAHHPNRGHLASDPNSPYLSLAADGNVVSTNNRPGSTILTTGADLVLPQGAKLTPGARIRVRTASYIIDEASIAAVDANRLALASPTTYPVSAGWGYFLLGQLWMLDSAGEWFHDSAARQLYGWMPNSVAPTGAIRASVLPTGIDLQDKSFVVVDGVTVRMAGLGVAMQGSTGVQIRNSSIEDIASVGVSASGSNAATLESNAFVRTGSDAIDGGGRVTAPSKGLTVRNNIIRDSGVLMQGEQVLSLPRLSYGAVLAGDASVVTGNTIVNTGYIGIRVSSNSVVENNFVYGTCTVLDDCGAIYHWESSGVVIRGNTTLRSRGAVQGKPHRVTAAEGIYLDDFSSNANVQDNTAIDADHGVLIHIANNNLVRGNRLYGNRVSQLWMQETHNRINANGDIFGNTIDLNQLAPTGTRAVGVVMETSINSTAAFGTFDRNRFYDRVSHVVVNATGAGPLNFAQWRQSRNVGSAMPVDANGSSVNASQPLVFALAGANLVGNSALTHDANGWASWNATAPSGQLVREACPPGTCLRYAAGGSQGVVASPAFAVQQGQWYRLTVDLATGQDNQPVQIVLRRAGGNYEALSNKSLAVTAGRAWTRYSMLFQAAKTANSREAGTGDTGARIDFDAIRTGQSLSLANLELVPVNVDAAGTVSTALVNAGAAATAVGCPFSATQPALCGKLVKLADDQPVTWPLRLAPRTATILYGQEPPLPDADRDGIPDAQDLCPGTPPGTAVNAAGCGIQLR